MPRIFGNAKLTNSLSAICVTRIYAGRSSTEDFEEVYQLAADMGGAGYIFTGEHDADMMHNSATINLNVLDECRKRKIGQNFLFFVGLHVPGLQSGRSGQSQLRGRQRLSGRARQRVWMGETCSASACISPTTAITA